MSNLIKKKQGSQIMDFLRSWYHKLKNRNYRQDWEGFRIRLSKFWMKVNSSAFGRAMVWLIQKLHVVFMRFFESVKNSKVGKVTEGYYHEIHQNISRQIEKLQATKFYIIVNEQSKKYLIPSLVWLKNQIVQIPGYVKKLFNGISALIQKIRQSKEWHFLIEKTKETYVFIKRFLKTVDENLEYDRLKLNFDRCLLFTRQQRNIARNSALWYKIKNSAFVVLFFLSIAKSRNILKKVLIFIHQTSVWQKATEIIATSINFLKRQIIRLINSQFYKYLDKIYYNLIKPSLKWVRFHSSLYWRRIPKDLLIFSLILLIVLTFFHAAAKKINTKGKYEINFECNPATLQIERHNSVLSVTIKCDTLEFDQSYFYKFSAPGYKVDSTIIRFNLPVNKLNTDMFSFKYYINLQKQFSEIDAQAKISNPAFFKIDGYDSTYVITLKDSIINPGHTYVFEEGKYRLKVSKPNSNLLAQVGEIYLSKEDTFNIMVKLKDLKPVFIPKYSIITITTNPSGSTIKILKNNVKIFQSKSPCSHRLSPGSYKIEAINPGGYMSVYRWVTLKPDEKLYLVMDHQVLPKTLTIYTDPSDAEVHVNGERKFGQRPIVIKLFDECQYEICVSKKNFYEKRETFTYRSNTGNKVMNFVLTGKLVNITINLEEDGMVYIDGKLINTNWKRNIFVQDVSIGEHDILIKYKRKKKDKIYNNFMIKAINDWPYNL